MSIPFHNRPLASGWLAGVALIGQNALARVDKGQ